MNFINEIEVSYKRTKLYEKAITSSSDVINVLNKIYDKESMSYKESFHILLLNRANHIIGHKMVAMGSDTACAVPVKEIVAIAIKTMSCGVILSHNHPSGRMKPSESDIAITKKIKQVLNLMDISLLDHVIMSPEGNGYSMAGECDF